MNHLQISAKCTGDKITAISECLKVAKAWGKSIVLQFEEGYDIDIRPTSEVQDLINIVSLKKELLRKKQK